MSRERVLSLHAPRIVFHIESVSHHHGLEDETHPHSFYFRTERVHQHTIYPYVHSFSNVPNKEALLRPVTVPDALPSDIPKTANFSLVAGSSPVIV